VAKPGYRVFKTIAGWESVAAELEFLKAIAYSGYSSQAVMVYLTALDAKASGFLTSSSYS